MARKRATSVRKPASVRSCAKTTQCFADDDWCGKEACGAVAAAAERDAEDVAALLGSLGLSESASATSPAKFSARLLLGLGVVTRLKRWQSVGVIELAPDCISKLIAFLFEQEARPIAHEADVEVARLVLKVSQLTVRCMSWHSHELIGAEVAVGAIPPALEDVFVEAVAQLCWSLRDKDRSDDASTNDK